MGFAIWVVNLIRYEREGFPEVPEPLPGEFAALLAPGTIEDDQVQVRIQPQIGRGPLHHGDRAGHAGKGTTGI
jgi:hypothetical protein